MPFPPSFYSFVNTNRNSKTDIEFNGRMHTFTDMQPTFYSILSVSQQIVSICDNHIRGMLFTCTPHCAWFVAFFVWERNWKWKKSFKLKINVRFASCDYSVAKVKWQWEQKNRRIFSRSSIHLVSALAVDKRHMHASNRPSTLLNWLLFSCSL